jgi:hypothetical protein
MAQLSALLNSAISSASGITDRFCTGINTSIIMPCMLRFISAVFETAMMHLLHIQRMKEEANTWLKREVAGVEMAHGYCLLKS